MDHISAQQLAAWLGLKSRAKAAAERSEFSKAEQMLMEVYEQGKEMFGPSHGAVGLVLLMLSEVCAKQGKTKLAAEYRAETRTILSSYVNENCK